MPVGLQALSVTLVVAPINVRVLSATHKDVATEVQAGRFRQDLFYRLNVIQIRVPPLRERLEDLGPICAALLERIARDAGQWPPPSLTREAFEDLGHHAFPGNVRELENLLNRAVAMSGGETISREDLGLGDAPAVEPTDRAQIDARLEQLRAAPATLIEGTLPDNLETYLDGVTAELAGRQADRMHDRQSDLLARRPWAAVGRSHATRVAPPAGCPGSALQSSLPDTTTPSRAMR